MSWEGVEQYKERRPWRKGRPGDGQDRGTRGRRMWLTSGCEETAAQRRQRRNRRRRG